MVNFNPNFVAIMIYKLEFEDRSFKADIKFSKLVIQYVSLRRLNVTGYHFRDINRFHLIS